MAKVTLEIKRMRNGTVKILIDREADSDELSHEHEKEHRKIVKKMIGAGNFEEMLEEELITRGATVVSNDVKRNSEQTPQRQKIGRSENPFNASKKKMKGNIAGYTSSGKKKSFKSIQNVGEFDVLIEEFLSRFHENTWSLVSNTVLVMIDIVQSERKELDEDSSSFLDYLSQWAESGPEVLSDRNKYNEIFTNFIYYRLSQGDSKFPLYPIGVVVNYIHNLYNGRFNKKTVRYTLKEFEEAMDISVDSISMIN